MRRISGVFSAAATVCAALITARCAAPGPSVPSQAAGRATAAPPCEGGTLGIEARPISRQLRKKLAIPDGVRGALVAQVLPDGPAAAADIRPGDVVEEIGAARIGTDCDFVDAAYSRSCDPVRVLLWRAGAAVEVKLVPREQEPYFGGLCRDGIAAGCFRQARTLWYRNRETDRDKALGLYQNACVAGSAEACAEEGLRLFKDKADRAQEAFVALQRSCNLGSGAGCTHLAFLYATGSGSLVKKDDPAPPRSTSKAATSATRSAVTTPA